MAGCSTQDTWTTISNHCPANDNPGIIDNNNCKELKEFYPDLAGDTSCTSTHIRDAGCMSDRISALYNSNCNVNQDNIKKYSKILLEYYIGNKEIITEKILGDDEDPITPSTLTYNLNMVKNDFDANFIGKIEPVIKNIDEKITTLVYETFNEFLNDKTKDTYQLRNSKDFNLFSWMNCSTIGQDYNATLSILKSSLTKELKIITYVSLLFEFLLIANLYIMVGLSKNLIDKQYEINEEKNVSIEEIDINEVKEAEKGEEVYSIKNKNKIGSSKKLDKNKSNYSNPTLMSFSGSDRRNLSQNGEKVNEIINMKRKNKKDIEDKKAN